MVSLRRSPDAANMMRFVCNEFSRVLLIARKFIAEFELCQNISTGCMRFINEIAKIIIKNAIPN